MLFYISSWLTLQKIQIQNYKYYTACRETLGQAMNCSQCFSLSKNLFAWVIYYLCKIFIGKAVICPSKSEWGNIERLDNGNFLCGIFVDLQKAFDTVDHSILLSKLCHYGIPSHTNNWFESKLAEQSEGNFYQSMTLNLVFLLSICL